MVVQRGTINVLIFKAESGEVSQNDIIVRWTHTGEFVGISRRHPVDSPHAIVKRRGEFAVVAIEMGDGGLQTDLPYTLVTMDGTVTRDDLGLLQPHTRRASSTRDLWLAGLGGLVVGKLTSKD